MVSNFSIFRIGETFSRINDMFQELISLNVTKLVNKISILFKWCPL